MHELAFPLLIALIALALAFDFLNGLHDAANSIATVVSTQLLSPVMAVVFAAVGNFAAYWIVGLHVAETVGKGIIDKDVVTPAVVFGALIGAMFWNVVTWLKGIPSSSSHALIGGLLGAGVAHSGFGAIESAGTTKTILAIFVSPLLGFALAMLLVLVTSWLFRGMQPRRAEGVFKSLHLVSSAAYSISHGGNDAQKTMGTRLTRLNHHTGFCASTAGSIVVFGASAMGIPVSTTHAITGSVIGTGAARRASAVRWTVAGRVVTAWFITIPASAVVGAGFYLLTRLFT